MKFDRLNIFRKSSKETTDSRLSDFLLHASEEEKKRVFTEVAQKANEDQRKTFEQANLKLKPQ